MKKRFFAALLALAMVAVLLPAAAKADNPPAYTMDFTLSSGTWGDFTNHNFVLDDAQYPAAPDAPLWSWDASAKTLTLNGFRFSTSAAVALKLPDGAIIHVAGASENAFITTSNIVSGTFGIYCGGSLAVQGTGTLEARGGTDGISYGVYAVSITVSGGTLNATGGTASKSTGVCVENGSITVSGGTLNATGGSAEYDSYGVSAKSGSLTVSSGSITVSGGTLTGTGGSATGTGGRSYGVYAEHDITVRGTGSLTGTSGSAPASYGVYAVNRFTLSGGTTTASGNGGAVATQPSFGTPPANTWYMWKESATASEPDDPYNISSGTNQFSNYSTAKYLKVTPIRFATASDVTVSGTAGTPIVDTDVTLTLTGETFKSLSANADVSSWFTNRPTNLSAKIKTAGAGTATVTLYGTPATASTAAMAITIPATALTGGTALTVTENANAKYNIAAAMTIPVAVSPVSTFVESSAPELTVTVGNGLLDFNAAGNYDGIDPSSDIHPRLGTVGAPGADGKVENGSIVITLKQSYLNTLAPGTYRLRVKLKGGARLPAYVETRIVVNAPGSVPKTGDNAMPGLWAGVVLLAGIGLAASVVRRRKNSAATK